MKKIFIVDFDLCIKVINYGSMYIIIVNMFEIKIIKIEFVIKVFMFFLFS